ncbi:hypothetical protein [Paraliomyxa miuraensis]|uniref:hypothetical protein n=1 Tax=Paraliomyxa miuraensis TaxID=376150 RepID=UPI0022510F68|nr:hypothetical protein [Paraliomyxa miuraensis]MCX4243407.1 hypothetical protein [Paraliomyxa miuraensis]
MTRISSRRWLSLPLLAALALPGCGGKLKQFVHFEGQITKSKMNADGSVTTTTETYDDWDEMKEALAASAKELRATTKELISTLVDVPPPGEVKLGDLSPEFSAYEGKAAFDFVGKLVGRVEGDGTVEGEGGFTYVQIGVPTYDEFFKASAEFHAFVVQTRESVLKLRALAQARIQATMNGRVDAKMSLGDVVALALKQAPDAGGSVGGKAKGALGGAFESGEGVPDDLVEMRDLALSIGRSAPQFVEKTQRLIQTGRQLVTGAPSSITNPKTVLHIDLIVKGLEDSVRVIGDSGKMLGDLAKQLATLKKQ